MFSSHHISLPEINSKLYVTHLLVSHFIRFYGCVDHSVLQPFIIVWLPHRHNSTRLMFIPLTTSFHHITIVIPFSHDIGGELNCLQWPADMNRKNKAIESSYESEFSEFDYQQKPTNIHVTREKS